MIGTSPIELYQRFGIKPKLSLDSKCIFIFIFTRNKINTSSYKTIKNTFCKESSYFLPIGYSLADYKYIETSIIEQSKNQFKDISNLSIYLIADPPQMKQILQEKANNNSLITIKQAYLCFDTSQEKEAQGLLKKYEVINKHRNNIQSILKIANQLTKQSKEDNGTILMNFICLGKRKYEQASYIMKAKLAGCINLQEKDFSQYKQKFIESLNSPKFQDKSSHPQVINSFKYAVELLIEEKMQTFCKEMLSLYQKQSFFYRIINQSLLKFTQRQFDWQSVALPVCLLFKAIKYSFESQKDSQQINRLFDGDDSCILWRAGKIYQDQLKSIKQNASQNPYYQLRTFTSTSTDKKIVFENFLDGKEPENNCIMQFRLKKPTDKQKIDKFAFMYLSYACMSNAIDYKTFDEKEVLLNALSVGKLKQVSEVTYKQIKELSPLLRQKFKNISSKRTIPVIVMEIGNFQDELLSYSKESRQNMDAGKRYVIQNYIMTLDEMKRYRHFDIGCSLRISGDLEAASKYQSHRINKIEETINQRRKYNQIEAESAMSQKEKCVQRHKVIFQDISLQQQEENVENQKLIKQENEMIQKQQIQNDELQEARQLHDRYYRLSDACHGLNLEEEAIINIKKSIEKYKIIEKMDTKRTFREHEEYLYRMYEKSSYIFKQFNRFHKAIEMINQAIDELNKKAQQQPQMKQVCQFLIVERQMLIGILYFKQGKFTKANYYFEKSQIRMKGIYEAIEYDNLKTETFYFGYIIHFFKNLFSGQSNDMDQYFENRRDQNISQATHLFGGREKFQTVMKNSENFLQSMKNFVKNNRGNLSIKDNELTFRQSKDENLQSSDNFQQQIEATGSNKIQMEDSFEGHEQAQQLKSKCDEFLSQFSQYFFKDENSKRTVFATKYKSLIKKIYQKVKDTNISANFQNISNLSNELIDQKLEEWKVCSSEMEYNESALTIKKKICATIIEALMNHRRLLITEEPNNRQKIMGHSRNLARSIEDYINEYQKWGYLNPTKPILNCFSTLIDCFDKCSDTSQQIRNIKKLLRLVSSRQDLIEKALQTYLLSIKLHYKIADFDFLNYITNVPITKVQKIEEFQEKQYHQCQANIAEAFEQIDKFESILYQKQKESRRIKRSFIRNKKQQNKRPSQNQIVINYRLEQHAQNVKIFNVQFRLWRLKIKLSKKNSKIKLSSSQQELVEIYERIRLIQYSKKMIYKCLYKQVSGILSYYAIQRNKTKPQQKNFSISIKQMKEALEQSEKLKDINLHTQILTKIFFMFAKSQYSQISDLRDKLYEQEIRDHPQFWKICLIKSFIASNQQQKDKYRVQCLLFMNETKNSDQSFNKYNIISECWNEEMKKRQKFKKSEIIRAKSAKTSERAASSQSYTLKIRKSSKDLLNLETCKSKIYKQTKDDNKQQANYLSILLPMESKIVNKNADEPLSTLQTHSQILNSFPDSLLNKLPSSISTAEGSRLLNTISQSETQQSGFLRQTHKKSHKNMPQNNPIIEQASIDSSKSISKICEEVQEKSIMKRSSSSQSFRSNAKRSKSASLNGSHKYDDQMINSSNLIKAKIVGPQAKGKQSSNKKEDKQSKIDEVITNQLSQLRGSKGNYNLKNNNAKHESRMISIGSQPKKASFSKKESLRQAQQRIN